MIHDELTRRELLGASSLAVVTIAGCSARDTTRITTPTPTAAEREYTHEIDDPETSKVHNSTGDPAITSAAHDPKRDYTSSGDRESTPSWEYEDWLVTSTSEGDALELASGATGREAANDFISVTDFSEQTLFIRQYRIDDCISVTLEELKWKEVRDGLFDLRFNYEDAVKNEGCEHETDHETDPTASKPVEAIIARIPVDIEETRSLGVMRG